MVGVDANDGARFEHLPAGLDVELLREIAAAGDLQDLRRDLAFAAHIRLQGQAGRAVAFVKAQVAASARADFGIELNRGRAVGLLHQQLRSARAVLGAGQFHGRSAVAVVYEHAAATSGALPIDENAVVAVRVPRRDDARAGTAAEEDRRAPAGRPQAKFAAAVRAGRVTVQIHTQRSVRLVELQRPAGVDG